MKYNLLDVSYTDTSNVGSEEPDSRKMLGGKRNKLIIGLVRYYICIMAQSL